MAPNMGNDPQPGMVPYKVTGDRSPRDFHAVQLIPITHHPDSPRLCLQLGTIFTSEHFFKTLIRRKFA